MTPPPVVHPVRVLAEIGSTNTEAMRLASAGERGPLWIRAERQLAGKGRSGRVWTSASGNLYASFLTTLQCAPAVVSQLSLVAGVAVCEAVAAAANGVTPQGLQLKWPNDVLIDGAKCSGILPEATRDAVSGAAVAVIGIGINLAHHPEDLGRPATHLAVYGIGVNPAEMLGFLSAALDAEIAVWDLGRGFSTTLNRWRKWGTPPGQPIIVHNGERVLHGTFSSLDSDGALILRDVEGYEHRITFGDVILAPPTQG